MSPEDTPDPTKSPTEPSVVVEHVAGDNDDDDDEAPALDRLASSNVKGTHETSRRRESPPTKKAWTEDSEARRLKSRKTSHALRDEQGKHDGSKKGPEYKQMCYLMFAPVSELELVIFEKCSFDQPPLSHPSPLQASDKPSPSFKTTYSKTTCWLQQSQKNIDHFWKKDTALVKALRQYHFASNVLEGRTQWKFQKSWILHKVLDVIALNMESTGRGLDFWDLMPMDQEFRHQEPDLRHLKAIAVKEVEHLTMVLVLDEDHTHYSNAFGNIFESGALSKKQFPEGSDGIKMKKGRPAQAIMCHFCPHACSNDNYAYHHLVAIHLNIQWGCGTCHGYISGYLSKIREHVQSHLKKSSREWSWSSCKKTDSGHSDSSSDGVSSNEEWSAGELEEEEDDDEELSSSSEVSSDTSDLG